MKFRSDHDAFNTEQFVESEIEEIKAGNRGPGKGYFSTNMDQADVNQEYGAAYGLFRMLGELVDAAARGCKLK